MTSKFTHLHVHSHYSLLDGLCKIPELVRRTKELGMDAIALTDHGVMYGVIEFYQACKRHGLKPIIGEEFYIASGSMIDKRPKIDDIRYHLTVLCQNNTGYQNLIKLTTAAHLEGFYYKPRVDKDLLRKHSEGLIALSGCLSGELAKTILSGDMEKSERVALEYQEIFGRGNYFLEISHHPGVPENEKVGKVLKQLSKKLDIPLVATQDVHYLKPEDKEAQDILVAVQTGSNLNEEDRLTLSAGDFSLKSPEEMAAYFKDTPEAVANTGLVADRCNLEIRLGEIQLPHFEVPEGETPNSFLEKLCYKGLKKRYGENVTPEIKTRLNYELSVIEKTGFATYFLIVQDFVNWAKDNGIMVGPSRGSVGSSLVAYVLGITNIDPLQYDLLFERFLNPERISMPDIDLDFTDTRRDEVLDYVAKKYGRNKVAQIITFGTMAARAAIRDAGRALGFPYGFCDQIAKLISFNPTQGMREGWLDECLKNVQELKIMYDTNPDAKRLIDAARKLEGVARHASVHAAGVVITKEPLVNKVPLQYASRDDQTLITQYEMHAIEDLGLLKIDFLGLKNLTIIEDTVKLIKARKSIDIKIETIPLDDKTAFQLLQQGKTTGVFQLESAGMKRYLKELKPTEMEDIIVMVSLYRPGPMELIPSYIKRKHKLELITYAHPKLEPILQKTYGVMVYQEQLMEMAKELAGLTLSEADILRKAVGKKIKSLLLEQKAKLVTGMVKNEISLETAEHIWNLVEPFARYGFNRSHAAGYAIIAYQTAYLKANWPNEFMCALLNAESADIERVAFLIDEAKSFNIKVLPPDINESQKGFSLVEDGLIRFGLAAIKNVGENVVEAIMAERKINGPFKDIPDFLGRIESKDLNKKSLESLIKAGAMAALGERQELLSNLEDLLVFAKETREAKAAGQTSIFDFGTPAPPLKLKPTPPAPPTERLAWEKELLGLYVSGHPLSEFKEILQQKAKLIKDLTASSRLVTVGGMLSRLKKVVTKGGRAMVFGQLQDFSGELEVVVFPDMLEKNPSLWQEDKILLVRGRVQLRDDSFKIICEDAMSLKI